MDTERDDDNPQPPNSPTELNEQMDEAVLLDDADEQVDAEQQRIWNELNDIIPSIFENDPYSPAPATENDITTSQTKPTAQQSTPTQNKTDRCETQPKCPNGKHNAETNDEPKPEQRKSTHTQAGPSLSSSTSSSITTAPSTTQFLMSIKRGITNIDKHMDQLFQRTARIEDHAIGIANQTYETSTTVDMIANRLKENNESIKSIQQDISDRRHQARTDHSPSSRSDNSRSRHRSNSRDDIEHKRHKETNSHSTQQSSSPLHRQETARHPHPYGEQRAQRELPTTASILDKPGFVKPPYQERWARPTPRYDCCSLCGRKGHKAIALCPYRWRAIVKLKTRLMWKHFNKPRNWPPGTPWCQICHDKHRTEDCGKFDELRNEAMDEAEYHENVKARRRGDDQRMEEKYQTLDTDNDDKPKYAPLSPEDTEKNSQRQHRLYLAEKDVEDAEMNLALENSKTKSLQFAKRHLQLAKMKFQQKKAENNPSEISMASRYVQEAAEGVREAERSEDRVEKAKLLLQAAIDVRAELRSKQENRPMSQTLMASTSKMMYVCTLICLATLITGANGEIYHRCSRGTHGTLVRLPETQNCTLPKNDYTVTQTQATIYVPNTDIRQSRITKCQIRVDTLTTYTSLLGSPSRPLPSVTNFYPMPIKSCKIIGEQLRKHQQNKHVEVSDGTLQWQLTKITTSMWSTQNEIIEKYIWCCTVHTYNISNLLITVGLAHSPDQRTLSTTIGDVGGAPAYRGYTTTSSASYSWDRLLFTEPYCGFIRRGEYNVEIHGDHLTVPDLQSAYVFNRSQVLTDPCVGNIMIARQELIAVNASLLQGDTDASVKWSTATFAKQYNHSNNSLQNIFQAVHDNTRGGEKQWLFDTITTFAYHLFKSTWQMYCTTSNQLIQNTRNLCEINPSLCVMDLLEKQNLIATFAAKDVLRVFECEEVKVAVTYHSGKFNNTCFDRVPVTLEDESLWFVRPGTSMLTKARQIVPCSQSHELLHYNGTHYKSQEGIQHVHQIKGISPLSQNLSLLHVVLDKPHLIMGHLSEMHQGESLTSVAMRQSELEHQMDKFIGISAQHSASPEAFIRFIKTTGQSIRDTATRAGTRIEEIGVSAFDTLSNIGEWALSGFHQIISTILIYSVVILTITLGILVIICCATTPEFRIKVLKLCLLLCGPFTQAFWAISILLKCSKTQRRNVTQMNDESDHTSEDRHRTSRISLNNLTPSQQTTEHAEQELQPLRRIISSNHIDQLNELGFPGPSEENPSTIRTPLHRTTTRWNTFTDRFWPTASLTATESTETIRRPTTLQLEIPPPPQYDDIETINMDMTSIYNEDNDWPPPRPFINMVTTMKHGRVHQDEENSDNLLKTFTENPHYCKRSADTVTIDRNRKNGTKSKQATTSRIGKTLTAVAIAAAAVITPQDVENDEGFIATVPTQINGTRLIALLDSGCTHSTIKLTTATQLGLTNNMIKSTSLNETAYSADGSKLHIHGHIKQDIYVGPVPLRNIVLSVIDSQSQIEVLLGGNVITQLSPHTTTFMGKGWGIINYKDFEIPYGAKFPHDPATEPSKCEAKMQIKPFTIAKMSCRLISKFTQKHVCAFIPYQKFLDKTGLDCLAQLVDVEEGEGKYNVIVGNPTDKDINVAVGTHTGYLETIDKKFLVNSTTLNLAQIPKYKYDKEYTQEDINHVMSIIDKGLEKQSHLKEAEKEEIRKICKKHHEVFSRGSFDLGLCRWMYHKIPTTGPPKQTLKGPLRLTDKQEAQMANITNELCLAGVIRPCHNPQFATGAFIKPKSDGTGRLLVDSRPLNAVTTEICSIIPRGDALLDRLAGSQYMSVLDLSNAYYQVEIEPQDKHKTAFLTRGGAFTFENGSQGLAGLPSTFSALVRLVLSFDGTKGPKIAPSGMVIEAQGPPLTKTANYLDDLVCWADNIPEMLGILERLFIRLKDANLKLSPKKMVACALEVTYIGFTISAAGRRPNPEKIKCIVEWPRPKTVKDIRSFVSCCQFFRHHVPGMADVARPLYILTGQNAKFKWSETEEAAFTKLKHILSSCPLLAHPDSKKPYWITTDASQYACGSMLAQKEDNEPIAKLRPIAYHSKMFQPCEQKLHTTERELLGVVVASKAYQTYIWQHETTFLTDHRALTYLKTMSIRNANSKIARWALQLSDPYHNFMFIAGKLNTVADSLSRINSTWVNDESTSANVLQSATETNYAPINIAKATNELASSTKQQDRILAAITHIAAVTRAQTRAAQTTDDIPDKHVNLDIITIPTNASNKMVLPETDHIVPIERHDTPQITDDGQTPKYGSLEDVDWTYEQQHDKNLSKIIDYMDTGELPEDDKAARKIILTSDRYSLHDNILYMVDLFTDNILLIAVPRTLVRHVLSIHHDPPIRSHLNHKAMYHAIIKCYHWPQLMQDCVRYVNSCETCGKCKPGRSIVTPPRTLPLAATPFNYVLSDAVGPFPVSTFGSKYIVTFICTLTMWPIAVPVPTIDAAVVAQAFVEHVLLEHGGVVFVQTDRGSCYNSRLFSEICNILGIRHNMSSSFHPQSQGILERYHGTLKSAIRSYIYNSKTQMDWCQFVKYAVFAFRTSYRPNLGMTPFRCLRGYDAQPIPKTGITYDARTLYNPQLDDFVNTLKYALSDAWALARSNWLTAQQIREAKTNETSKANPIMEGDVVYLRRMTKKPGLSGSLCQKYNGPFTVRKVYGKTCIVVPRGKNSPMQSVHVDTVKVAKHWQESFMSDTFDTADSEEDTTRKRHNSG